MQRTMSCWVDIGVADGVEPRVVSLGKKFQAVRREPVIV